MAMLYIYNYIYIHTFECLNVHMIIYYIIYWILISCHVLEQCLFNAFRQLMDARFDKYRCNI